LKKKWLIYNMIEGKKLSKNEKELLDILKKGVSPASGCTEPAAVAYSAAIARKHQEGELVSLEIWTDPYLFKNGMRVGMPGVKERGLDMAAALGFVVGRPEKGLLILDNLSDEHIQKAQELIKQKKITVRINERFNSLYIETLLATDKGTRRVIIKNNHLNVVSIDNGKELADDKVGMNNPSKDTPNIQEYDIEEIIKFASEVPVEKIFFLQEGIIMNDTIAKEGLALSRSIGKSINKLIEKNLISENAISRAQILCTGASEARMSGSRLSLMSVTGSDNHGLTVFLTLSAVAQVFNISKEKILRGLALSILLTAYIKSFTGTLSAMCGCGVAAGVGASAGVAFLLDGGLKVIKGAMQNMVGSISGLICDGAKEGCAYKLALASGWAIESALLALNGTIINESDGIVNGDFEKMIRNLGYVCTPGMDFTNQSIVNILTNVCE
jgi:L-cysteine desulfidase